MGLLSFIASSINRLKIGAMNQETNSEKNAAEASRLTSGRQACLFAQPPDPGVTIGVVSVSEPSSLALLAAGVAGMAERRARRAQPK